MGEGSVLVDDPAGAVAAHFAAIGKDVVWAGEI